MAPSPKPTTAQRLQIATLVVVVIALFVGIGIYRANQIRTLNVQTTAVPSTEKQTGVMNLVQKLADAGAPIKQDELPTVAMIKDAASLKKANQSFYQDANNGDLIYIWSDRVVLYSQSKNKVLQYEPLIPEAQEVSPTNLPALFNPGASIEAEGAHVEIRNASSSTTAGKNLKTVLLGQKISVSQDIKTLTTTVPKTLIIPTVNKPMRRTLEAIVKATGGQLTPPTAQYAPFTGDILVVIGDK